MKKHGGSGKVTAQIKTLVEKIEATRTWVEKKRTTVSFAPNDRQEVANFLQDVKIEQTPIGGWMRLQTKVRDQKREDIEAALREERSGNKDDEDEDENDEEDDFDIDVEDDEDLILSEDD